MPLLPNQLFGRKMKKHDRNILLGKRIIERTTFGLFILLLVRKLLGMSEREFMATPVGGTLVWILSGAFTVTLLVILPLAIHKKEVEEGSLVPNLPHWAGRTIRTLLFICVGLLVLMFVGGFILYLFSTK